MDYPTLAEANAARQAEWLAGTSLPLTFRTNEMAGELGEVAELLLDRWTFATRFGHQWQDAIADELADVIICASIIAWQLGQSLDLIAPEALAHAVGNDYKWSAVTQQAMGLLCNAAKKMDRTAYGIAGGISEGEGVAMVTQHLVAMVRHIYDLAYSNHVVMPFAIARKFNKTSAKVGLQTLFIPPGYDRALLIP